MLDQFQYLNLKCKKHLIELLIEHRNVYQNLPGNLWLVLLTDRLWETILILIMFIDKLRTVQPVARKPGVTISILYFYFYLTRDHCFTPLCPPWRRSINCILLGCLEVYYTILTGWEAARERKSDFRNVFFNKYQWTRTFKSICCIISSIWSDKREYYLCMMVLSTQ